MHADMVRAAGGGGGEGGSGWELDWMYVDVGPPYRKRVVLQHQQVSHSLTRSLTHSLAHSLTYLLSHSLTRSLMHLDR